MTAPLPYTPEELETLRNGSQYQTRQNARWFATLEQLREGQRAWQAQSDAAGVAMLEECALRFFESEQRAEKAESERDALRVELERERMRLVACGVVAGANTPESAARERQMHADYRSPACDDVAAAVDREMALRAQVEAARAEAVEHLGDFYTDHVARNILRVIDEAKP